MEASSSGADGMRPSCSFDHTCDTDTQAGQAGLDATAADADSTCVGGKRKC